MHTYKKSAKFAPSLELHCRRPLLSNSTEEKLEQIIATPLLENSHVFLEQEDSLSSAHHPLRYI
jgi:hypothetical protein